MAAKYGPLEDISVADALDKYIISLGGDREPDGKYHPSSLFQCARKVIYGLRGTEKTESTEPAALRRFYIGHRLHEAVQAALMVHPSVDAFYPEVECVAEVLNIDGHGDGLLRLKSGKWVLVELKSIRKSGFRYVPREDNIKQAETYAVCIRDYGCRALSSVTGLMEDIPPLGEELIGILVVYLEKEDMEIREFFIPWEDKMRFEVVERIEYLDTYRNDSESLPPRIKRDKNGKLNWECRFCPFQRVCWNEDPEEVKPN